MGSHHRSSKSKHKDKEKSSRDKKSKKSHGHRHGHRHRHSREHLELRKSHGLKDPQPTLPFDATPIDDDDFYLKATEFRVWLRQYRGKYLDELPSDQALELFSQKFVSKWNSGKLDPMFYSGIPDQLLDSSGRTRHRWQFVTQLDDQEKLRLASTKDSVDVATRRSDLLQQDSSTSRHRDATDRVEVTRRGSTSYSAENEDHGRDRSRRERHQFRRTQEHVMEELVPKETGRQALLEKRRQVADRLHGAARARDDARDGLDLGERFLMGSDGNELQKRLASRQQARERVDKERQARLEQAQAKEAETMKSFLRDMGIDPNSQQRITIAPRK